MKSGILEFAQEIAREAGEILLQEQGRAPVEFKGVRELVTAADRKSEEHLARRIHDRFPSHGIIAEEGTRRSGDEARWFIDPLDATTNYVHGHPMFTVSLGVEVEEGLVVGVVWAPRLAEMFAAEKGSGATLNGDRIGVSSTDTLQNALMATGFAYNRHETSENNIGNFSRILLKSRGVRRGGCASLDLAYVAAGRFDGFWEIWLQAYDVAAGSVLVQEAGGRVTDQGGGKNYLLGRNIIASNGLLHGPIAALLDPFEGDTR